MHKEDLAFGMRKWRMGEGEKKKEKGEEKGVEGEGKGVTIATIVIVK